MKIKFKNFQALKSEEIEFSPGLTLITGPTDNGKTAIFRGLLSFLTNSVDAPAYINGDASKEKGDEAELSVTLIEEGLPKIEFHRTKSKAWYMIDGKKFSKLARTTIFDIYPDMHKKFVYDPNDSRKILNFQSEGDSAFPFDRSDAEMFKLFEKIFNISDTKAIMDTLKKEDEDVTMKLNMSMQEKARLETELEILKESIGSVNRHLLLSYIDQYKHVSSTGERLRGLLLKIASYANVLKESACLPQMSQFDDNLKDRVVSLAGKIDSCLKMQEYIGNCPQVEFSALEDVEPKVASMKNSILKLEEIESKIQELNSCISVASSIKEQTEQELKKFSKCPLCGHDVES